MTLRLFQNRDIVDVGCVYFRKQLEIVRIRRSNISSINIFLCKNSPISWKCEKRTVDFSRERKRKNFRWRTLALLMHSYVIGGLNYTDEERLAEDLEPALTKWCQAVTGLLHVERPSRFHQTGVANWGPQIYYLIVKFTDQCLEIKVYLINDRNECVVNIHRGHGRLKHYA